MGYFPTPLYDPAPPACRDASRSELYRRMEIWDVHLSGILRDASGVRYLRPEQPSDRPPASRFAIAQHQRAVPWESRQGHAWEEADLYDSASLALADRAFSEVDEAVMFSDGSHFPLLILGERIWFERHGCVYVPVWIKTSGLSLELVEEKKLELEREPWVLWAERPQR